MNCQRRWPEQHLTCKPNSCFFSLAINACHFLWLDKFLWLVRVSSYGRLKKKERKRKRVLDYMKLECYNFKLELWQLTRNWSSDVCSSDLCWNGLNSKLSGLTLANKPLNGLHAHVRKMHDIQEVSCKKKCKSFH